MSCLPASSSLRTATFVALYMLAVTGCHALDTKMGSMLGDTRGASPSTPADPNAASGAPTYVVELRAEGKSPAAVEMPLTEDTFIQQSLEKSGALRRFRRMNINVYRPLADGNMHKIRVSYDHSKRRVDPGSDYAIHPNDRVVVTEDTSTVFDDMLQSISGPAKTAIGY